MALVLEMIDSSRRFGEKRVELGNDLSLSESHGLVLHSKEAIREEIFFALEIGKEDHLVNLDEVKFNSFHQETFVCEVYESTTEVIKGGAGKSRGPKFLKATAQREPLSGALLYHQTANWYHPPGKLQPWTAEKIHVVMGL